MEPDIVSLANPKIKWVRSLHKNNRRKKESVFLVEGLKEIQFAFENGYLPKYLFVNQRHGFDGQLFSDLVLKMDNQLEELLVTSEEVFSKISYREDSDGALAVFYSLTAPSSLEDIKLSKNPLLLIVEAVEKPGNLGAIIRTADGCGADAVIICDEKVDPFNPNVIRASVGTVFSKPVVATSNQAVVEFLQMHGITAYGAIIDKKSISYYEADFSSGCAIVLGTEHEGLSDFWKSYCQPIMIPMCGQNDSLNVSNAAAVLGYEILRQRKQISSQ